MVATLLSPGGRFNDRWAHEVKPRGVDPLAASRTANLFRLGATRAGRGDVEVRATLLRKSHQVVDAAGSRLRVEHHTRICTCPRRNDTQTPIQSCVIAWACQKTGASSVACGCRGSANFDLHNRKVWIGLSIIGGQCNASPPQIARDWAALRRYLPIELRAICPHHSPCPSCGGRIKRVPISMISGWRDTNPR
jgi:hypothetical protein